MEGELLLFDDMTNFIARNLSLAMGCGVVLVNDLQSLEQRLRGAEAFSALLVEPFVYWRNDKTMAMLRERMEEARADRRIPVVVYSTEDEIVIGQEFLLRRGTHYDAHVSKWGSGTVDNLKSAIDGLLLAYR